MASSAHERMGRSHPGLGGDTVGGGCSYEELPCITHRHLLPQYRCPAVPLPAGGARPAGSPQEDGPGRLQQREGSCMTIQYNLSPFPLPSSRGDGYCLIPFDSSFIICLPPSSFPVVPPRLLCGRNQSLVSDDCLGGREGKDSRVRVARPLGGGGGKGARHCRGPGELFGWGWWDRRVWVPLLCSSCRCGCGWWHWELDWMGHLQCWKPNWAEHLQCSELDWIERPKCWELAWVELPQHWELDQTEHLQRWELDWTDHPQS